MNDTNGRLVGDAEDNRVYCPICAGTKAVVKKGTVTECKECDGDGKTHPPFEPYR